MPVIQDPDKVLENEPALEDVLNAAKKHMKRSHPPLTEQQLEDRLPPRPHPDSNDPEEAALSAEWNNDPLKRYMLESGGNTRIAMLWRYPLRFMDTFVEEIIGPRYDLAYNNDTNQEITIGEDQRVRHPYWAQEFCRKLFDLLTHPTWMGQPGALAVALQYVVKCRTNDQRRFRWPRENYTTDKFVDVLQDVHELVQDGTKTVVDLRKEAERRVAIPSPVSRLFRRIEAIAFDPNAGPLLQAPGPDLPAYRVSTADLTSLIGALDSQVDVHGLPLHRRTATTASMVTAAKHSYDLPKTKMLEMCRERVLLSIRREEAAARKLGLRHPSHRVPSPPRPSTDPSSASGEAAPRTKRRRLRNVLADTDDDHSDANNTDGNFRMSGGPEGTHDSIDDDQMSEGPVEENPSAMDVVHWASDDSSEASLRDHSAMDVVHWASDDSSDASLRDEPMQAQENPDLYPSARRCPNREHDSDEPMQAQVVGERPHMQTQQQQDLDLHPSARRYLPFARPSKRPRLDTVPPSERGDLESVDLGHGRAATEDGRTRHGSVQLGHDFDDGRTRDGSVQLGHDSDDDDDSMLA
ncbi:hypothetical protein GGR56DRAFT_654124 [Xylariaceae sp. FL0804]|nr:hypothetical protein GGR56DRAFT_654124 [Xylariaceae sp. FL0804]